MTHNWIAATDAVRTGAASVADASGAGVVDGGGVEGPGRVTVDEVQPIDGLLAAQLTTRGEFP